MAISHLYPDSGPALNLNFVGGRAIPPNLTISRAGTATYVDRDGFIKYAEVDEGRIDYDPSTLECRGLLSENSTTNYVVNSNVFGTGYTKTNATQSASSEISPDGVSTVDQVIENTATSTHILWIGSIFNGGTSNCYSLFLKPIGSRVWIRLWLNQLTNSAGVIAYFNLEGDGSIGTTQTTGSGAVIEDIGIEKFNNGWYRVWISGSGFDGVNNMRPHLYFADADGSITYTGDGTSGFYVWGWQLEINNGVTSFIPTSGSTVSRASDIIKLEGENYSNLFDTVDFNKATFQFEYQFRTPSIGSEFIYGFGQDNDFSDSWYSYRQGPGFFDGDAIRYYVGTSAGTEYAGNWEVNTRPDSYLKMAFATEDSVSSRLAGNGILQGSDTAANVKPTFNNLTLGARTGGGFRCRSLYIKKFAVWNDRLNNNILVNLTR